MDMVAGGRLMEWSSMENGEGVRGAILTVLEANTENDAPLFFGFLGFFYLCRFVSLRKLTRSTIHYMIYATVYFVGTWNLMLSTTT
jgi:hypothetical protein